MEVLEKVTKKEGDGEHPSSHYLVVEDPSKPTTWHLRVRGTDGKPDHTLMGAAWAALHGGYRGNKYAGPNKEGALKKLMGMYHSENMPMPGMGSKALIVEDKAKQKWFIGIYSNNFMDRDGQIISKAAHQEYVSWLKTSGVKPPIVMLHRPKFPDAVHIAHYLGLINKQFTAQEYNDNLAALYRSTMIAQAESVFELNGFMFVIGKILNNKLPMVEQLLTDKSDWGMSHGFIITKPDNNIIARYRTFEFSVVPADFASNGATTIGFSEDGMGENTALKDLSEQDRALLQQVLGEAENDLEQSTAKAREILARVLQQKADVPEETPTETLREEGLAYQEIRVKLIEDMKLEQLGAALKAIDEKFAAYDALLEIATKEITGLKTTLAQVKQTEDEKVAAVLNQGWMPNWEMRNVATKTDNAVEQDAATIAQIKDTLPQSVVADKSVGNDNPIKVGFYDMVFGS